MKFFDNMDSTDKLNSIIIIVFFSFVSILIICATLINIFGE